MKNKYLILYIIMVFVSFEVAAQSYSDGCMTLTIKATRAYCQEYEDPVANDEPDWQWWFLDNANLDGSGWNGGNCLSFDSYNNAWHIGWWNHNSDHSLNPTIFNETYGASGVNNANVPQYVSLRGHYEGDDCGGSCDKCTSLLDDDDYRYDETVASNINYRGLGAPNTNNIYQVITTNHGSSDFGGEFTMNWTSPRPVATISIAQICLGESTSVTLNFSGAVSGGSYEIYDGGSLVHSTTSSSWTTSLTTSKTYQVYTRNNGANSNCYSEVTVNAVNCDFNCRTRGWTSPTTINCPGQLNIATTSVSFNGLGFPTSTYIADTDVEVEWSDTDAGEVNLWFYSQNGGTESTSLVDGAESQASSFSFSNGNHGSNINTIFDEDASTPSSPFTPTDNQRVNPPAFTGFYASTGNVDFDKWEALDQNSATDWYIRAGASNNCSDATFVVHSYNVTICGCQPPVANSASVTDGVSSSTGSITICEEQGGTIELSVTGSTSAFDSDGYGDELKWFEGGCGSGTSIGSGNPLVISAPNTPGTHQYFAMFYVDDEKCRGGNYCDQVDVVVDAKTVEGQIETLVGGNLTEDICETSLPPVLTITGNTGSVVIWQQSTDGASFTDVIGTVGLTTYTPGGGLLLSDGTYYFRAKVKNNTCDEKVTPNFVLNVLEIPVGGTISPNPIQDVCHGDSWTFTLTSHTGNIQWQESNTSGGVYADVASSGSTDTYVGVASNLTTSAVSQFYRVEMKNAPCPSSVSNIVELVSHPNPTGGTTASDQVLCYDETPLDVTLSGNTGGTVAEWEIDTDPLFGSPTIVSNTTNTLTGGEVRTAMGTPLNQALYVRAVVGNSGCPSTESSKVDLDINNPEDNGTSDQTGSCTINSNSWVHIFDASTKEIIGSIDGNGQNLGNVTVSVFYHGGSSFTIPATGSCVQQQAVLNRSFVINSANTFANPVGIRLYFKDSELADLIDNSLTTQTTGGATSWTTHDPSGCEDNDDVLNIGDLYVTQISGSGALENGNFDAGVGTFTLHTPTNSGIGDSNFGANYLELSVTGFSEFWVHGSESGVPLPVEFINFDVVTKDNKVINTEWTTATEINNAGFEVQRSTDGVTFNKVAWVVGKGNSNEQQNYNFIDENVSVGVYYYRLKQIDFDGAFEYSEIKSASILGKEGFSLSFFIPNPALSHSQLDFNLLQTESVKIKVVDNIGREVDFKEIKMEAGNQSVQFNTTGYASGVYTAKIIIDEEEFVRRLVIRK